MAYDANFSESATFNATFAGNAIDAVSNEVIDIRTAYDGTTYPTAGDAVRGQVSDLQEAVNAIDGISGEMKTALLNCFAHAAWEDANGTNYYNALKSALGFVPVTGITLSSTAVNVYKGYTITLTATVAPDNATDSSIIWTCSDDSIATVTANGNTATITGIDDGSVIITAITNDGGYMGTCTATIATAVPTSITLSNKNLSGLIGSSDSITAAVLPTESANKTLTWTTSDSSIATVTPSADTLTCTINFVGVGSATITATSNVGSVSATCAVTTTDVVTTPIVPTFKIGASNSMFEYAYFGATKADIDTSDTSTIKNQSLFGRGGLVFDCRGINSVRIKLYVKGTTYTNTTYYLYAFNQEPSYNWGYKSDITTSETTDACFRTAWTLPATSGKYVEGDVITLGDYTIDQDYPFICICNPYDINAGAYVKIGGASTAEFTYADDTYAISQYFGLQIAEIE